METSLPSCSHCPPRVEGEGGVEWLSQDCFPMHRPWVHDPAAALDYGFGCSTTSKERGALFPYPSWVVCLQLRL